MRKMVLIGGGVFSETIPFLKEIITLSEKSHPNVSILPTAAADAAGERNAFSTWKDLWIPLDAHVEPLYLLDGLPDPEAIEECILQSDIIYVPGGDTYFMLRTWRRLGVDKMLKKAYRMGTVLSGRSAGANCWFRHSITGEPPCRSARFYSYRRVTGLGLIDSALCTHYQDRKEPFKVFLQQFGGVGLGLEDNQAMVIKDGFYRLLSLKEGVRAYKVFVQEVQSGSLPRYTKLCEELIVETDSMASLESLLQTSC